MCPFWNVLKTKYDQTEWFHSEHFWWCWLIVSGDAMVLCCFVWGGGGFWALFFCFWAHWNFRTLNFEYLFDFLNVFGGAGLLWAIARHTAMMWWCFAASCLEAEVFKHSSFGSESAEISELLTLNICLSFWTNLMELAYCEPPPDTQRWCDGALLLRVRRRRFLSALLLVLSARARFLYSVAYYDLRLKRSSSGRCWAARAKRLLCYWILEIQVSVFGTSPSMPNMHMSILHTMISINVNDVCKIQW